MNGPFLGTWSRSFQHWLKRALRKGRVSERCVRMPSCPNRRTATHAPTPVQDWRFAFGVVFHKEPFAQQWSCPIPAGGSRQLWVVSDQSCCAASARRTHPSSSRVAPSDLTSAVSSAQLASKQDWKRASETQSDPAVARSATPSQQPR